MDTFTLTLWVVVGTAFMISIVKNKTKTFNSMKIANGMMKNIAGQIIGILFLIGLILTFIPPDTIKNFLGGNNIFLESIGSAIVGSLTLIPAFVAFPLIGSLMDSGANVIPVVAFLTTLTMVGIVTFPLEKKEFGFKFALTRNTLSFIFAILISIFMGVFI